MCHMSHIRGAGAPRERLGLLERAGHGAGEEATVVLVPATPSGVLG